MQLLYQGKDITSAVAITSAAVLDSAGGKADSIDITFSDTQGLWSAWTPTKGDIVQLTHDGYDSGACYIDEIQQARGLYTVQAISMPEAARERRSRSWEQVTLLQLAVDIAARYGFQVRSYGAPNPIYARVDQSDTEDFAFLAARCALESCAVKLSNRQVIIYDEPQREAVADVGAITPDRWDGAPQFMRRTNGTYAACRVSYGGVSAQFTAPGALGPTLVVQDLVVSSIGEADRWARGKLREANRNEYLLRGAISLQPGIAGGSMVPVTGLGTADGLYMADEVLHDITGGKTRLRLRRKLEGY